MPRYASAASALLILAGCAERTLEPRKPTPGAFHFTVQTFNVEFRHWNDPATVKAIGESRADVICLQEVTPQWQRVVTEIYGSDYANMLFHASEGNTSGGLAVLSRFPLTDMGIRLEPHGWHPAWHVAVDTPGGPLQILNVHLRAPLNGYSNSVSAYLQLDEDHLSEIQLYTKDCAPGTPTLVVGDFNEVSDGSAIRFLADRGYRDILPLYHPGQWTWRYRSLAGQFNRDLDHIVFNDRVVPLDAWVKRSGNSDHIPVVAHFEMLPKL